MQEQFDNWIATMLSILGALITVLTALNRALDLMEKLGGQGDDSIDDSQLEALERSINRLDRHIQAQRAEIQRLRERQSTTDTLSVVGEG